jgi:hypothetical protein
MNCSNRQKSKVLNLIYKALNAKFGDKVDIKRDALHRRYDVNKFCLEVTAKNQSYKDLIDFLNHLCFVELQMNVQEERMGKSYVSSKHGYHICFDVNKNFDGHCFLYLFLG